MAGSGWRGPRPPVRWRAMNVPTQMAFATEAPLDGARAFPHRGGSSGLVSGLLIRRGRSYSLVGDHLSLLADWWV